jgi:tRNA threonylcarbamoyladenosine biosynthesis protein TsaE
LNSYQKRELDLNFDGKPNPLHDGLIGGVFCETPAETMALGRAYAAWARAGLVISLEGVLGAGKTQFVKGLAEGVGFFGTVSSPTFTLMHEYRGGELPIYHFDFYRLKTADDVIELGFNDYLGAEGIVAIEWGDRFPEILPPDALRIRFELDGAGRRISQRSAR